MIAGGRPDGGAAVGTGCAGAAAGVGVCVAAGADADELAGGATTGEATVSVAILPLLAAKGAVAQVPTQRSGAGGAACDVAVVAVSASRARRGRIWRRGRVVTAGC